jgi:hypothetical protein
MGKLYDTDIVAWAEQQAALLRAGKLEELDLDNIAEEIDDVGKREKHELKSRLAVLIAHLLKWQLQPERRGHSWSATIENQREEIEDLFDEMPSLKHMLEDEAFIKRAWRRARGIVIDETGMSQVPRLPVWHIETILDQNFLP